MSEFFLSKRCGRHRPQKADVKALRAALYALPVEARTFPAVQELAAKFKINGQTAWKMASALGAPPRNSHRAGKKITEAHARAAYQRWLQGAQIAVLAREIGCSESAMYNRIYALRDEEEIEASFMQARKPRAPAAPRFYQSPFLRPVTPEMACGGRARTRPTLAPEPAIFPTGP